MNRQSILTILLTVLMSMAGTKTFAHDIEVMNDDGISIYYNYINEGLELEVTGSSNTENLVIPEEVVYLNKTLKVTSISSEAFYKCSSLKSVTIPNSVTYIGDMAFTYCNGLTSITIPPSVKSIGDDSFFNCLNLESVYCLPEELPSIGYYTFSKSVIIYVKETAFFSYLFSTSWQHLQVRTTKVEAINVNGICYSFGVFSNIAEVEKDPNGLGDKLIIEIPEIISYNGIEYRVKYIGDYAFNGYEDLIAVNFPNSILRIGKNSFENCKNLIAINMPENVIDIGDFAFHGCSSLSSISIPDNTKSIGIWAFNSCSNLKTITIGKNVEKIGYWAFDGCSNLNSVVIPNNVSKIETGTFNDCRSLNTITIGSGVNRIYSKAFKNCKSLNNVHISNLTNWCQIEYDDYDSNPMFYASHLFFNNEEVKDLIIPSSITNIKKYAFIGCSSLNSVTIPTSVKEIEERSFESCSGLTSLDIPNSVTCIGSSAFINCTGLRSLKISDNITSIGESAFKWCSGLTSLNIPNKVTSIEENAFQDCTGLISITLSGSLIAIKTNAFCGCSSLSHISIPASVKFIYPEAFAYCSELKYIKSFSETPPFLYDNSFSDYNVPVIVPTESVDAYKDAQGWKNFYNINDKTYYKLVYKVDGAEYKSYNIEIGTALTPEEEPTQEGYTFSGWSEIPIYMPAKDVTISGSFTINKYNLTYLVENEVYKTLEIEYGLKINKEEVPTKDGYLYSGWTEIPETMPSHDVEINGRFYMPGDANGDDVVNIADIVEIVNFENNKPSEKFDELAANVTGDDKINEDDIAAILNIIMNSKQ